MVYGYAQLVDAYRSLGLREGQTVYVAADLTKVMGYEHPGGRAVLEAHDRAIRECIGEAGTVVVSTASLNICNTDAAFDPAATPSFHRGAFSEHIRLQSGARRSFHPFRSYAALGPRAAAIVDRVTRHATGPQTPEARMAEVEAIALSIGLHPRFTCSTVHQVEHLMSVPYRYTKEYMHPVVRNGTVATEPFYMHVLYRDTDLVRDNNQTLFERLNDNLLVREAKVGAGRVYSYNLKEFITAATKLFADDIYVWCAQPPRVRPYQQ